MSWCKNVVTSKVSTLCNIRNQKYFLPTINWLPKHIEALDPHISRKCLYLVAIKVICELIFYPKQQLSLYISSLNVATMSQIQRITLVNCIYFYVIPWFFTFPTWQTYFVEKWGLPSRLLLYVYFHHNICPELYKNIMTVQQYQLLPKRISVIKHPFCIILSNETCPPYESKLSILGLAKEFYHQSLFNLIPKTYQFL